MTNNKRTQVPRELERELKQEAGWRCAIPTCRQTQPLEMAHIIPYEKCKDHTFENMIILCANCHSLYDKKQEKTMTPKAILQIKDNLKILNGRYSPFELRLMQNFLDNPAKHEFLLYGREIDVMFLIKDGLLKESSTQCGNSINFPPKTYILTEAGMLFIKRWKDGQTI